ncbi:ATP-dependent Clp protease proteolytic subunit [Streptomyces sp. NPDC015346]|uniref:ATP-dependent Clp protease proteolytic subunit n=1 Tax=Streptomyces sp. NPDC015346 TaxID=3364954 RepID=UPI0036FD6430
MPSMSQAAATCEPLSAGCVVERLLRHRTLCIGRSINSETADRVIPQLLLLGAESDDDITLYINSPGGLVTAGLAIYDTMQHIGNDITTIGLGFCASMAQLLLTAGTPGKRFALPNTRMMLHLPAFTETASPHSPGNRPKELRYTQQRITHLISRHTLRETHQVIRDFAQDRWFSPAEAKDYGLIDAILTAPAPAGPSSAADGRADECSADLQHLCHDQPGG